MDPLDDLWCRYGLSGCSKPSSVTQEVETSNTDHPPLPLLGSALLDSAPASQGLPGLAFGATPGPSNASAQEAAPATRLGAQLAVWGSDVAAAAGMQEAARPARLLLQAAESSAGSSGNSSGSELPLSGAAGTGTAASAAEAKGTARAVLAQAGQAAAPTSGKAPVWALLLLGGSVLLPMLVQLWHFLPHSGLLRQVSQQQEALAVRPAALLSAGTGGSADVEAAAVATVAAVAAVATAAPVVLAAKAALGQLPLPQAELPLLLEGGSTAEGGREEQDSGFVHQQPPGSPGASSNGSGGSGSSGRHAAAPAELSVDPSVRARDISRRSWTQGPGCAPEARQLDATSVYNPLFTRAQGGQGQLDSPGDASSPASLPIENGAEGSPAGTAPWQAKKAGQSVQLGGRSESEAGEDSFRLLAAAPPAPEGSHNSITGSGGELPAALGSPGKPPRGGAARKLTGAKSIKPQELPPLAEAEEGTEAAGSSSSAVLYASAAPPTGSAQSSTAGASLQPELSAGTLWAVHATTGTQPPQQSSVGAGSHGSSRPAGGGLAALRGLRLLTPQQFRVSTAPVQYKVRCFA